jgi:hypothetical protein
MQVVAALPSLPDLSSLAPLTASKLGSSGSAAADVPHVLTVLSRTRSSLNNALTLETDGDKTQRRHDIDLLRMKEQIVLTYLAAVTGLEEDGDIIPWRKTGSNVGMGKIIAVDEDYYGTESQRDRKPRR